MAAVHKLGNTPMDCPELSRNRVKELSALRLQKYRQENGLVVIEGKRTLEQLKYYGISPREQYLSPGTDPVWPELPAFAAREGDFRRICDSETPQGIVALFTLPQPREVDFELALYLDGIADPGNLGGIFRSAAAFGIDTLLLSPGCVEVASPKVIRASLGSVYVVPYQIVTAAQLAALRATTFITDTRGSVLLRDFCPAPRDKTVVVIGSEAHGVSPQVAALAQGSLRIGMREGMESLNAGIAAALVAHHLYNRAPNSD